MGTAATPTTSVSVPSLPVSGLVYKSTGRCCVTSTAAVSLRRSSGRSTTPSTAAGARAAAGACAAAGSRPLDLSPAQADACAAFRATQIGTISMGRSGPPATSCSSSAPALLTSPSSPASFLRLGFLRFPLGLPPRGPPDATAPSLPSLAAFVDSELAQGAPHAVARRSAGEPLGFFFFFGEAGGATAGAAAGAAADAATAVGAVSVIERSCAGGRGGAEACGTRKETVKRMTPCVLSGIDISCTGCEAHGSSASGTAASPTRSSSFLRPLSQS